LNPLINTQQQEEDNKFTINKIEKEKKKEGIINYVSNVERGDHK
jgi:hypothetical protein